MTKTIASATDSSKHYFLTINSDGQAQACTCGDYQWRQAARGGSCKHMKAFNQEVRKAETFLSLKAAIEAKEREQAYTNYLNWQLAMGL